MRIIVKSHGHSLNEDIARNKDKNKTELFLEDLDYIFSAI